MSAAARLRPRRLTKIDSVTGTAGRGRLTQADDEPPSSPPRDNVVMRDVPGNPELIIFIAGQAGMSDRLVATHVPDEHGRCQACPNGVAVNMPWPCPLHRAATDAANHLPRTNRRRT